VFLLDQFLASIGKEMSELARFAAGVLGTVLDPVAATGYIGAGLASNRVWQGAIWGLVWAVAIDIFVRFVDQTGCQGQYVALRIVGVWLSQVACSVSRHSLKLLVAASYRSKDGGAG
jgi:hypothetical protein